MPTEGERIATLEQSVRDLRREFDVHLEDADRRSNRIREMEAAVMLLIEAQKTARAAETRQYRRVEVRLQALTVAVAFAALMLSLTIWLVHH